MRANSPKCTLIVNCVAALSSYHTGPKVGIQPDNFFPHQISITKRYFVKNEVILTEAINLFCHRPVARYGNTWLRLHISLR